MTLRQPHSSLTLLNLVTNFLKTRTPAMTDAQPEMKIDPARAKALVSQLQAVQERVTAVAAGRNVSFPRGVISPAKSGMKSR